MAQELPAPIEVSQGPMKATATHEQFGATIQPWNVEAPITIYLAAGIVEADGTFIPLNGTRSDTGGASPLTLSPNAAEWASLSSQTEWQRALYKAAQLFRYIESGRDPALRPAWFPAA